MESQCDDSPSLPKLGVGTCAWFGSPVKYRALEYNQEAGTAILFQLTSTLKEDTALYKVPRSAITLVNLAFVSVLVLMLIPRTAYGQGGLPKVNDVRVINTASEPVPTTVQGTATVTGNVSVTNTPTVGLSPAANGVQAQQSGAWSVGISGTPTVNLAAGTSVGIAGTPTLNLAAGTSVGITGTPTVNLSAGTSVGITGTPTMNLATGTSVGIVGTPNVNLVPGTSVQISNTMANPIPVQNVGGASSATTLLFNSGTVPIPNAPGSTSLGDFNASSVARIRVAATSNCGFTNNVSLEDLRVWVFAVESGQQVQVVDELKPCANFPLGGTKLIDMPGVTIRIVVVQGYTYNVAQSVRVVVYGR